MSTRNQDLSEKNADMRYTVSSKVQKPLFLVPFDRDDSFINRIGIFNDINRLLKQHSRVALSGIGGIGSVAFPYMCGRLSPMAKVLLGNHRSQSNTATAITRTIPMHRFSGFMPVQNNDLIKHTEISQEDLRSLAGTTPTLIHFVWSLTGLMKLMGAGLWWWTTLITWIRSLRGRPPPLLIANADRL